jgi:hypothetical protein
LGPEQQSQYAAAGSAKHKLGEAGLRSGKDLKEFIGMVVYSTEEWGDYVVDQDMIDDVQPYVDYARSLEGDMFVEQKVTLAPAYDDVWGTADLIVCRPGHMTVCDLKTGQGHRVELVRFSKLTVEEMEEGKEPVIEWMNWQLIIYLFGAHMAFDPLYDFNNYTVAVSQPPLDHHVEWDITRNQLYAFAAKLKEVMTFVNNPANADLYVPSEEACRWCRARSICPALRSEVDEALGFDLASDTEAQELAGAMDMVPKVKAWVKGVEDAVKERLLQGRAVPTYKVVEGRRARAWKDQTAVQTYLKKKIKRYMHNAFNIKFKTPAQIEKLLKDETLVNGPLKLEVFSDKFIQTNPGKPTVVPETDKREAIVKGDTAVSDFQEFAGEVAEEDLLS